jgi:acyl-CoA reductase-like NAD-dependent aldehyde dehydrogenase
LTLDERFARLRAAAAAGAPSPRERRAALTTLVRIVRRTSRKIAAAVEADFGTRSRHETRLTEIFPAVEAARYARRRLARWTASERVTVAPYFWPARARILRQPLGVVGIIAPWNYPLVLALGPLVSVLAAGNRAMIKMSEYTPRTAEIVAQMLHAAFADDLVRVECGGIEVAQAFAALPFDHLLFTGSTSTGRSVMRAAAANLTPVTLELGGKSPVIVGPDAPLERAAARILSGKCRNAGQTCIAPDYVLLPAGAVDAFVEAARRCVTRRYPALPARDYTSIVNDAHYDRLAALAADAAANGARVIPLHAAAPPAERATRLLPPAIVTGVNDAMRITRDEIFGPLLPLVPYTDLDAAIAYVNARPRPLALYYFGRSQRDADLVLRRTHSGGACVNDVMLQFAQNALPFGGIGASGMGAYHGRPGYERFSHQKAVFEQAPYAATALFDPPYGLLFDALLRLLSR